MSEILTSVGLDVGTTSTQLIVSRLTAENRASGFAVPELAITGREVLYRSPVHFTPLLGETLVDGEKLRQLVEEEYRRAGLSRQEVDTGAVIITGETSRRENARAVTEALAEFAGDFVVATAGPELESILAAKGSGAVEFSEKTGKTVLHLDIGGGTSNFCRIRAGTILDTGCLNVGGRLLKLRDTGEITYVSPALQALGNFRPGQRLTEQEAEALASQLARVLEMGAGLRAPEPILSRMVTGEGKLPDPGEPPEVISFSGGVADCIEKTPDWLAFGDLGPKLGRAIRESRLCRGPYRLGTETIRATVIGAGCHSTQLSGSTVFHQNMEFPQKNLPVVEISEVLAPRIREGLKSRDGPAVLAIVGLFSPDYSQIRAMAGEIARGLEGRPAILCLEADMAKALGQALALQLGPEAPILCIDRVKLRAGSYLDVAAPLGPALPVVVKTLIFERKDSQ